MSQEAASPFNGLMPDPDPAGLKEIFELVAAGLYSLASMLVGEGEESARLVVETIASAQVSPCADPQNARRCSRRALAIAALKLLAQPCPGCVDAPQGLMTATPCMESDDLASAGISTGELEGMRCRQERERSKTGATHIPN